MESRLQPLRWHTRQGHAPARATVFAAMMCTAITFGSSASANDALRANGSAIGVDSRTAPGTAKEPASPASSDAHSDLERGLKFFVDGETRKHPGRVEVRLGNIDSKLRLAPCARVEPYLPSGARLWGRTNIGVRCLEGAARWNVYLPIEVRVFAPALVAVRPIAVGQSISAEDIESQEIDITREPPGVLLDPAQLEARVTGRAIMAGTPLRADMLRAKPVIAQGDVVKVVFLGTGFTVAAEGKALAAAGAGQSVRVQMDSGRIVSGTAREGRQVELR